MGCRISDVMDVLIRATTEVLQCFNLTKMDNHLYDAPSDASQKTNAKRVVYRVYDLGLRRSLAE